MSWGIAETASDIEKIKSESADYLNGLNSCGVIDWNTYNYAFDFYADLLMKAYKQGEKDTQPENADCIYCHEDSEGYVKPIEKNSHAFIRFGMDGWEISMSVKGWNGSAKIMYCPMCGRKLKY